MKKRNGLLATAILGGSLWFSSGAHAAISYSYVTDMPAYTVQPGANLTVLVYLKETLTNSSNWLITADSGLFAGGYSVTQSASGLPANPSQIFAIAGSTNSNGSNFPGGSFTQVAANQSPTFMNGDNAVLNGNFTGPTPTGGLIELGAITIKGGTTPGTTTFVLGNYSFPTGGASGGGYTLDQAGNDLDVTGAGYNGADGMPGAENFAVTVPSPEPASLTLLGLGSVGLLLRRRRPAR